MSSKIYNNGGALNQKITTNVISFGVTYGTTSAPQFIYENTSTTQKVIVYPYLVRSPNVTSPTPTLTLTYYIYCKDTNSSTYFSESMGSFSLGSFVTGTAVRITGGNAIFSSRSMVSYILMPGEKLYVVGQNTGSGSTNWDVTTLIQVQE
jgi:hypothetical protein